MEKHGEKNHQDTVRTASLIPISRRDPSTLQPEFHWTRGAPGILAPDQPPEELNRERRVENALFIRTERYLNGRMGGSLTCFPVLPGRPLLLCAAI